MKKPEYLSSLIGIIFFVLGITFLGFGILTWIELLPVSSRSKGDPKVLFPITGLLYLTFSFIMSYLVYYKKKQRKWLVQNGISIQGEAICVKQWIFCRFNGQHPYVIYFKYKIDENIYKKRSHLYWSKPSLNASNQVMIYVDFKNPKKCALNIE